MGMKITAILQPQQRVDIIEPLDNWLTTPHIVTQKKGPHS
jgi:hypothetical protein